MTAKFKQIIEQLNALISFKADKTMTDDDFIANVDAINALCNLCDDLNLDRSEIRKNMDKLYPEFARRVYGKSNIQQSMPLIKALYRYIYDRGCDNADRGPVNRRNRLLEMCCKVVASYKDAPATHIADYIWALTNVLRSQEHISPDQYQECNDIVDGLLEDIDSVPDDEKIRRVSAYQTSRNLVNSDKWERWTETLEIIRRINLGSLDDDTLIEWAWICDSYPMKEFRKRSADSKRIKEEYLQGQICEEFRKLHRSETKKKLARGLKNHNDDIIGDIVPIEVDSTMTVATLTALGTIFYLRLQLAQAAWDDNEPTYNLLCKDRYEQINKALRQKYAGAASVNEKIEILERLQTNGLTLNEGNCPFALEEASSLEDFSELTDSQRLRLDWLKGIESEDYSGTVALLLPQVRDAFDIETLSLIQDFATEDDRNDIFNRFVKLFNAALQRSDSCELAKLLNSSAYWNINPAMRQILANLSRQATSVDGLSLPERRVNSIAAEIYSHIDKISGKYDFINEIPA